MAESCENQIDGAFEAGKDRAELSDMALDPVQEVKKRMRLFLSITDIDNFYLRDVQMPLSLSTAPKTSTSASRSLSGRYVLFLEDLCSPVLTMLSVQRMREQWRSAHFRTIKAGHVSGILLEQAAYRETILEVVALLKNRSSLAESSSSGNGSSD